jgi:hypothetical protein
MAVGIVITQHSTVVSAIKLRIDVCQTVASDDSVDISPNLFFQKRQRLRPAEIGQQEFMLWAYRRSSAHNIKAITEGMYIVLPAASVNAALH